MRSGSSKVKRSQASPAQMQVKSLRLASYAQCSLLKNDIRGHTTEIYAYTSFCASKSSLDIFSLPDTSVTQGTASVFPVCNFFSSFWLHVLKTLSVFEGLGPHLWWKEQWFYTNVCNTVSFSFRKHDLSHQISSSHKNQVLQLLCSKQPKFKNTQTSR